MKMLLCPNCGRLMTPRFALCDCPAMPVRKWKLQVRRIRPTRKRNGSWRTVATFVENREGAIERMDAHSKVCPGVYQLVPAKEAA